MVDNIDPATEDENTPVSPVEEPAVSELQSQLEQALRDKAALESRIGDATRKFGEDKQKLEQQWMEWGTGFQTWTEEQLRAKDEEINSLTELLLENVDAEGAKKVIQAKTARDAQKKEELDRRAAAIAASQKALVDTKRRVALMGGFDPAELDEAKTEDQVWELAATLRRRREEEILTRQPVVTEAPAPDPAALEQAAAARPPRPAQPVAPRRSNPNEDARLKELEEALAEATKRKKMAEVVAIRGEIISHKRQLQK